MRKRYTTGNNWLLQGLLIKNGYVVPDTYSTLVLPVMPPDTKSVWQRVKRLFF